MDHRDLEQERFEARRDRRSDDLQLENKIAAIARQGDAKLLNVLLFFIAVYGLTKEYGGWGWVLSAALLVAIFVYWAYVDRNSKEHQGDLIDDWAERTVLHERIAAAEQAGLEWIEFDERESKYGEFRGIYENGFYKAVNATVLEFQRLTHRQRKKRLDDALASSLGARTRMQFDAAKDGKEIPHEAMP